MGTLGDLTGFIQTILIVIVGGALIAIVIYVMKEKDAIIEPIKEVAAAAKETIIKVVDVPKAAGAATAQKSYDYYYEQSPAKAEAYAEYSPLGRTLISLGDFITLGQASKAGAATQTAITDTKAKITSIWDKVF